MKFAVGLLAVGLTLTACSGSGTAAPPPVTVTAPVSIPPAPTADPAVVSWVDGFCSAVNGYRKRTNAESQPGQPQPKSVAEAQKALSAQLGAFAARTGEVVDKLTALPAAPVPLAETVRTSFLGKFTTSRDRAAHAKTALDGAKPGDEASQTPAADAVEKAQQDLDGTYDPVAPLAESQDLLLATATAPGCKM
ncbi:hypothetical protein ACIOD2_24205 [Amycolatopsis sp. NPDC088138]|uniref:hypothetical protein n=1 Tax=Amycolatopsis sp. NPDC088138 TaxID=3363938 RepID=UPI00381D1F60